MIERTRKFLTQCFTVRGHRTLKMYRKEFWEWSGHRYEKRPKDEIIALAVKWLEKSRQKTVTYRIADDMVKLVGSEVLIPHGVEMPCWLDRKRHSRKVIAFGNGLLELGHAKPKLKPHDPRWFSASALDFDYDPKTTCPDWLAFLNSSLPDADAQDLLQRIFGLLLTPDTSYQKIFVLLGRPRSGKGTICRAIRRVVGNDACSSPMLGSLGTDFGLSPLLGKTVAFVPEAALGKTADRVRVLETIKMISGEDAVNVNRKNLPILESIRLPVRFVISVNDMPRFEDSSGALAARLRIIRFETSFAGREDMNLESKLSKESPGIFNWALEGLRHLQADRTLPNIASSKEALKSFRRLTSPVTAFVEDRCRVGSAVQVSCSDLYATYDEWAKQNGHPPLAHTTFGEELRSAFPEVRKRRLRKTNGRFYIYDGIELSTDSESSLLPGSMVPSGPQDIPNAETTKQNGERAIPKVLGLPGTDSGGSEDGDERLKRPTERPRVAQVIG